MGKQASSRVTAVSTVCMQTCVDVHGQCDASGCLSTQHEECECMYARVCMCVYQSSNPIAMLPDLTPDGQAGSPASHREGNHGVGET